MRALLFLPAFAVALVAGCGDPSGGKPAAAPAVRDPLLIAATSDLRTRVALGEAAWAEVRETLRAPGRIEVDETRMARLKAIVPACETLAIAADHRVSQDNPQALAAAVDDFIRRSSSGA